jgi:hypothetical protein
MGTADGDLGRIPDINAQWISICGALGRSWYAARNSKDLSSIVPFFVKFFI